MGPAADRTQATQGAGLRPGNPGQEPHEQNRCRAVAEECHRGQVLPSESASSGRVGTKPCRRGRGYTDWNRACGTQVALFGGRKKQEPERVGARAPCGVALTA